MSKTYTQQEVDNLTRQARVDELKQERAFYVELKQKLEEEARKLGYGVTVTYRSVEAVIEYIDYRLSQLGAEA